MNRGTLQIFAHFILYVTLIAAMSDKLYDKPANSLFSSLLGVPTALQGGNDRYIPGLLNSKDPGHGLEFTNCDHQNGALARAGSLSLIAVRNGPTLLADQQFPPSSLHPSRDWFRFVCPA